MESSFSALTPRRIELFCMRRLASVLPAEITLALQGYLVGLLARKEFPPYRGTQMDFEAVADAISFEAAPLRSVKAKLQPIFDAVCRSVAEAELRLRAHKGGKAKKSTSPRGEVARRPVGRPRKAIEEFPEPVERDWDEPDDLGSALRLHANRHGETIHRLYKAVVRPEDGMHLSTLLSWARGEKAPRSVISLDVLRRIERRYRLPKGYFAEKAANPVRAATGFDLGDVSPSERRRLAWHLPDDFNSRPRQEQVEILDWVRTVIVSGSTDYRRYQVTAMRQHYAIRFSCVSATRKRSSSAKAPDEPGLIDAPAQLNAELSELLKFKTSTFAAFGLQRNGVWGEETASQRTEHFALWFGAFAAPAASEVRGYGADPNSLTFAMMVFPQVWDWYLQWREQRRGFYTKWEVDLLTIAAALTREETGWLRQMPRIGDHLREIEGLISRQDIDEARADWAAACDRMFRHARRRVKEIARVARIHRDPFEPILPVLEAPSPVGEYRKITEEILRRMPDERRQPRAAAEAVRAFLLLRIGLHTGLRQKNLRELLLCRRDQLPTPERRLEDMKRGELRWSPRDHGWEILIPSVAFKNASSSFFGSKPFRLILPDLGGLYEKLEAYIDRHRARLIGPATDPGTFFVKTAKMTSTNAAYNQNTFYEAWRLVIQRYGIFNPWTRRGAIEGLLPHGPHNVRDVLATHILKQTGSYEQASYAIQDTPEMVAQHYGRFLPQDKAEIAARILNKVWEAA
ncbi:hypothetical protein CU669_07125 [Paramagnetospirillum kuznetsovii]|uniref:Uncharacterized protein n=1 Tax=Paramagnetospirillum kuznetsovii TaxID=2053833 RepID=A0A364NZH0_9PROT|nr:hypothetical protein [Paramagnetospirillum kuznetsovii]RAU22466.1 hypothetical protein CU669_07125 [Paramagnetospirillum kuznetsovii]